MSGVVVPYGSDAVLVELPGLPEVRALDARLRARPPQGVVDVVPAARTVLVRGHARTRDAWAGEVAALASAAATDETPPAPRTVEIPVVYDGEDLEDVARATRTSTEEVVARHLAGGPEGYRVAFGGFMPGFAYVVGLDPALHLPRLGSPRTRVPAGSVAVAGEFTAVYPAPTPGGWRLLGRTDLTMFDVGRGAARAALLAPGDVVRFTRVPAAAVRAAARPPSAPTAPGEPHGTPERSTAATTGTAGRVGTGTDPTPARTLTVVAPGPLSLVEDLGRAGLAAVGVPRSGAADPAALARANRLVGNAHDAAGLEVTLGGLVVTFGAPTAFALEGAVLPVDLDGTPVPTGVAVRAPAGSTLTLGTPPRGLRTWLAVRGGVDVPEVLGSRSRDVLSGLGPAPLRPGDVLALGLRFDGLPDVTAARDDGTAVDGASHGGTSSGDQTSPDGTTSSDAEPRGNTTIVLPAGPGPRLGHLDDAARHALWHQVWDVSADSNRVAVRLDGPPLRRATTGELASEGVVLGAVQVPHDGRPVLFGPDHPVTGGYPVVAVLTPAGVARAAQLRPGDRVRLAPS
ncbi:urea amidolyase related protein [Cellulomonas flavigena DSM 20109]|uniref:Urea amidolyase related protein n=1 Tax=Cellulomonas flavigena (strain ATCC 482 / DSM 20109 / BCRC 11376 / JCM 18109 / NBRC 3775 / NCIMB 8073 / NRS 134) TaxID=446466 RepID=D5UJL6_CELFN|nr:5-oxoprolinase/urea amidolyase family protein [Cellulomonas flavigena]ADG75654.1 urea amidolyase related protein [Cellulomonas flavigena DSM 20109]